MPQLEELCTLTARVEPAKDVGATPIGHRQVFDVAEGRVEGPKLSGVLLPSGADWLLVDSTGVGRVDVRALIETPEGARIYVTYTGVLVFDAKASAAIARGEGTEFGDIYFMTTPRFETGHPDYAWLNAIIAVGQGRLLPGGVEYRIFAVGND